MSELMETKKKFSLEELSELTGISRRTIRFYIQRGLMNGPEGEKRGAFYTTEHLEDLLRIKRMTEKHIPLNEIRRQTQRTRSQLFQSGASPCAPTFV